MKTHQSISPDGFQNQNTKSLEEFKNFELQFGI